MDQVLTDAARPNLVEIADAAAKLGAPTLFILLLAAMLIGVSVAHFAGDE